MTTSYAPPPPIAANAKSDALQRKRYEAGVVLSDLARKTGFTIAELLELETAAVRVDSASYARVSGAIAELRRERNKA